MLFRSGNEIFGLYGFGPYSGFEIGQGVANSIIERNKIHDIQATNSTRASGIYITSNANASLTFSNNMIWHVLNNGTVDFTNAATGFHVQSGGGQSFYFNSVNLFGNRDTVGANKPDAPSAGIYIVSTASNIIMKDNIFANTMTAPGKSPKSYAVYLESNASLTTSDYNAFFISGSEGVLAYAAGDRTSLLSWQSATAQDANSTTSNPQFISNNDLHIRTEIGRAHV